MFVIEGAEVLTAPGEYTRSRVVVDGTTIREVGPDVARPAGARVLDLSGTYLVPGLIDLHTHLTNYPNVDDERVDRVALQGSHRATQALRIGMTGARNLGSQHGVDLALRDAINAGRSAGPRMRCAATFLVMTGGHSFQRGREADGADEVRKAAREQLKKGADLLKIMCSAGVSRPDESPDEVEFTTEEIAAAVDVAAAQGTYVAAHAHPAEAVIRAARAGVRSIEHGSFLTEEAAAEMVAHHMFLVPTFAIYTILARSGTALAEHGAWVESAKLESHRIATAAGVAWGVGSDSGVYAPVDAFVDELVYLHDKLGLSGEEILSRASAGNAALMGLTDVGTIAPGKRADLVAVRDNPLDGNLETFRTARCTIAGGVVYDWTTIPEDRTAG